MINLFSSRNQSPRIGQPVWGGAPLAPTPAPPSTTTTPSALAPTGASIVIRVLDPERNPVEGARVTAYAIPLRGSRYEVEERETDSQGISRFVLGPIPTEDAYRYDLVIQPGSETVRFSTKEVTGPPDRPSKHTVVICPAGVDSLVCEVASLQEVYRVTYADEMDRWGNESFASRMAVAAVRNTGTTEPRLQPFLDNKIYGVVDLRITPQDWPEIDLYWQQTQRVLNNIPWPKFTGAARDIGRWFRTCALNVPITVGFNGRPVSLHGFWIYSPTQSDFFPKTDQELRQAFAAAWATHMPWIVGCVSAEIKERARRLEAEMQSKSLMGLIAAVALAAFAGPAAAAVVLATEGVQHYKVIRAGEEISRDVEKAIPQLAELLATPNLTSEAALTGILVILLEAYLGRTNLSPAAKAVIGKGLPAVIDLVLQDVAVEGTTSSLSVTALGQGVLVALAKLLGAAVRAEGFKDAKELGKLMMGYGAQAENAMIPFQLWLFRTLFIGKLIEMVAEEAGIDFEEERDLYEPAEAAAESVGVEVPASAKAPESTDTRGPVSTSTIETVAAPIGGLLLLGLVAGVLGS